MYCKYCGKEIADDSKFCRYCGKEQDNQGIVLDEDSESNNTNDGEALNTETKDTELDTINDGETLNTEAKDTESITINDSETLNTEKNERNENIKKSEKAKKKPGCFTIFMIAATILFANFVIRPMAKLYMRQKVNHQIEASGVYGAGLDRAEPIMDKLRKAAASNLGKFGKVKKVYYGVGTIIIEFVKEGYDNLPKYTKERVGAEIRAMPNSVKDVMKEIVDEDFSLTIEIHSENIGSGYTRVYFSPSEIRKAINQ